MLKICLKNEILLKKSFIPIISRIHTKSIYDFEDKHELMEYKKKYTQKEYIQVNIKKILKQLEHNTYFLGFDLSSRSTGYTILDVKDNLIDYGLLSPKKEIHGDVLEISDFYINEIKKIKSKYNSDINWVVGIEMCMKNYHAGIFQTNSLFLLAEINSITNYNCWKLFEKKPLIVHPSSARHSRSVLGIKSTGQRSNTKQVVLNYVHNKEPRIEFPSTADHYLESANDIADSYIIALYTKWRTIYNMYIENPQYLNEFKRCFAAHYLVSQKKTTPTDIPHFETVIEEKYKGPFERQLKKYISMELMNNNEMI